MRLAFESVKHIFLPMWVGIIQWFKDLNKRKDKSRENSPLLCLIAADLGHWISPTFRLRLIPLVPLILRPSDSD